ncbi:MAG: hypothetical protein JWN27_2278, partial [Candidatus Eremiobacteraeota bacterium]|nr:hypothetical protein [Candidatus Eremiobacteraeota bacterium]
GHPWPSGHSVAASLPPSGLRSSANAPPHHHPAPRPPAKMRGLRHPEKKYANSGVAARATRVTCTRTPVPNACRRAIAPCVTRGLRQAQPDNTPRQSELVEDPSSRIVRLQRPGCHRIVHLRVTRVARVATPEFAYFFDVVHPARIAPHGVARDDRAGGAGRGRAAAGRLRRSGARRAGATEQPSDRSAMDGAQGASPPQHVPAPHPKPQPKNPYETTLTAAPRRR